METEEQRSEYRKEDRRILEADLIEGKSKVRKRKKKQDKNEKTREKEKKETQEENKRKLTKKN